MIRTIKFSNFYSFDKEQEISFVANKKESFDYFQSKTGDQITKVAGFVGSNASGKTNVMRLFGFLAFFIYGNTESNHDSLFCNFFNNARPSKFYVEFEIGEVIYFYTLVIKKDIVVSESLKVKDYKSGARLTRIFSRNSKKITALNATYFKDLDINSLPGIKKDSSFVTFINKSPYSIPVIDTMYEYFTRMTTNINEKGTIIPREHKIDSLRLYLDDKEIRKKMEDFICHFDVGLEGFRIELEKKGNSKTFTIDGIHRIKSGSRRKLSFDYESRGTKSLFFAMGYILYALKHHSVIILDEIETGFHPEALSKLIDYFIAENKHSNAQLIFSSHSLGFINKFDMHQIYLVSKDIGGESLVKRLNSLGVRSDENFLAKYLAGSYGSFPKINI